jgi:hypothetical protein
VSDYEVNLLREGALFPETLRIHIYEYDGWKVGVTAYDGVSSMPSISENLPAGSTRQASVPLFEERVAHYRSEGWVEELPSEVVDAMQARRDARDAAVRAKEEDLQRRRKAFPSTELDRVLAAAVARPEAVRVLDLRPRAGSKLSVVPTSIKKLAALEVLRLDGNDLPELPEELGACKLLRELYLAGNALTELPGKVYGLKSLTHLDVRGNRLTALNFWSKGLLRLEAGDNPLDPAEGRQHLTGARIGNFQKLTHVSVDTDDLFPIDLSYLNVDYKGVTTLPTPSISLYGRAPTDDEAKLLRTLFPRAKIEHRARFDRDAVLREPLAEASPAPAPAAPTKETRKPGELHPSQAAKLDETLKRGKKAKLPAGKVKKLARPSITLLSSPPSESARDLGISRLGGSPDLPDGVPWPVVDAGPMTFVGQIALAELAPFDPKRLLPASGLLAFFASGYNEGAVVYVSDTATLATRQPPSPPRFGGEPSAQAPACAVSPVGGISLPASLLASGDDDVEDEVEDAWREVAEEARDERDTAHRMLGHTYGDVEAPPEGDLALLAVGSDPNARLEWGDAGVLYFMISEAALRERRWSEAEVVSTD